MDLIEAEHLSRSFGELVAVNDLSLKVASGEIYGLVGPDGAGKTTTLRLLCGAYQPSNPSSQPAPGIHIAGIDMLKKPEEARAQIGYLPQRFSLYEELTVIENIRFFAEVRGLSSQEWEPRCQEILAFVGLETFASRRAGFLSGGMKQKLGLAAALVHRPRVLLLDEPTTGVDPVTRQDFWQLLIRLIADSEANGDRRPAVFVSTPYMDEAVRCTRLGFMTRGRIVLEGTPGEIRLHLRGRILELAGTPLGLLRRIAQADDAVEDVHMFGDRLHLRIRQGQIETVIQRLPVSIQSQGGVLRRLEPVEAGLEDVFIGLLVDSNTPSSSHSADS
jgi:ABC-2 type transport system ATP-binding protein